MKNFFLTSLALGFLATSQALAHDIHNVASDHTHPGPVYTHSVSSQYDHYANHHYDYDDYNHGCYGNYCGKTVTNTATYYSRSYPTTKTYIYQTTPNTTIHQPPYAYSSCANNCCGNCQSSKRIMMSSKTAGRTYTYRAPSEYQAGTSYIPTPRKVTNCNQARSVTHVSPYQTYKLTTCTGYGCQY